MTAGDASKIKTFRAVLLPESKDPVIDTVNLSNDFRKLLSKLAQQHLRELAEQRQQILSEGSNAVPLEAQIQISELKHELATLRSTASVSSKTAPAWEVSSEVGDANLPGNPEQQKAEMSPNSKASKPEEHSPEAPSDSEEEDDKLQSSKHDVSRFESQASMSKESPSQKAGAVGFYYRMRKLLSHVYCDLFIGVLILINVVFMFLQCHYDGMEIGHSMQPNGTVYEDFPHWIYYPLPAEEQWPGAGGFLKGVDMTFTIIFALDVTLKIIFLGLPFWKSGLNLLDFAVVVLGMYALADAAFQNPSYMRMLRLAKMGRLAGALANSPAAQSLQLLMKCIGNCVNTLGWSLCVLLVIQSIMGLTVSSIVQNILEDKNSPLPQDIRDNLFYYYGTFSKTILTMFQILFANWIPCARVLIDNVSELFSLFFVFYRCLIGFAVMSVISAVFVQSTMKVAQQDQELLIVAKQREKAANEKNLQTLFAEIDSSGDGFLSHDELMAVVHDPKMGIFMQALEIDTKDLETLFTLLDDGDGEISIDEFLGGIGRLRGPAKALDMASVIASCSKIEHLLKEIKMGTPAGPSRKSMAMKDW